jgi:dTDP-4-amino-4,6-dideoxygalactose transaminase
MATGAVPVVAEVDDSLTIDPEDARARISPRTRAVIAVHMRGAPADMERVGELAAEHDLKLFEDVAQSAGASFRGRRLGAIGDAGAFSFHHAKVITSGEGGMLVTDDAALHGHAAMYHDAASPVHAGVAMDEWQPGLNLRMSELQAAVARTQLRRLDALLAAMRIHKARLKELIAPRLAARGVSFRTIHDAGGEAAVALVIFLPEGARTAEVASALADQNVPAGRLYHDGERLPEDYVDLHVYPHWTPVLRRFGYSPDACPRTVALLRRAVHIDVSPDLTSEQVDQMAGTIAGTVEKLV